MIQRCRCCLSTKAQDYHNIHEEFNTGCGSTYAEFIHQFAAVEIGYEDGLPQVICGDCFSEVQNMLAFSLHVRRSDEELRNEQKTEKHHKDIEVDDDGDAVVVVEEQMDDSLQGLESEYFSQVEDVADDSQMCAREEIFEQDGYLVEEIHEVNEIHLVDEIEEIDKEVIADQEENTISVKGDLLVELAHVAATQENVDVIEIHDANNEASSSYPEDENDEDYLIEFNDDEVLDPNLKPPKWKCGECKVILRGDVSYEGHMNMHKQLRPHKCTQCSSEFRCRTALKKHHEHRHTSNAKSVQEEEHLTEESKENVKTSYLCIDCKEQFSTEISFYFHEIINHNKHTISTTCPLCPNITVENLKDHIQTSHTCEYSNIIEEPSSNNNNIETTLSSTTTVWQCYVCSQTYQSLELLENHYESCHKKNKPKNLKIRYINDDDVTIDDTTRVVYIDDIPATSNVKEPAESSVQCEICKKKILRKNLSKHLDMHNRKDKEAQDESKKYLCTRCPREFKNSKSLQQHEKTHEGESADVVYVCGDCGRQYASEFLLETHRKQAHKERDNICPICGNAFKLKNQLVNHMKLHLEKNIPCPHCNKKYSRQFDLNVHLRSHTGEQPFACHLCDKRFAIKVRLTYHLQKHYGIKHQCKECGAEFNSKQKLKSHSFKHTGMPYRCELCDDHGFATRDVFKRHLNRVHRATLSDDELNKMFHQNTGKTVNIEQVNEQIYVQTSDEEMENTQDVTEEKTVVLNSSEIFMETEEITPDI